MRTYTDFVSSRHGVLFPADSRPSIKARHIDGPLLCFSDGQLHWLTAWERVLFAFGMTDAEKLERKRRPNLVRLLAR